MNWECQLPNLQYKYILTIYKDKPEHCPPNSTEKTMTVGEELEKIEEKHTQKLLQNLTINRTGFLSTKTSIYNLCNLIVTQKHVKVFLYLGFPNKEASTVHFSTTNRYENLFLFKIEKSFSPISPKQNNKKKAENCYSVSKNAREIKPYFDAGVKFSVEKTESTPTPKQKRLKICYPRNIPAQLNGKKNLRIHNICISPIFLNDKKTNLKVLGLKNIPLHTFKNTNHYIISLQQ